MCVQDQPGLHSKFQACRAKPCLKKKIKTATQRKKLGEKSTWRLKPWLSAKLLFPGRARSSRLPQHSLDYHFYRKFYSTYNIFQQKGNIQENWCTPLLQKQTEVLGRWERSVACSFYLHSKLDTQLALAPTKRETRRGLK